MSSTNLALVKPLKTSKILLLGIAAGLILINLNIAWKCGHTFFYGASVLIWFLVCYRVWKKRHILSLETGVFSSFLGILLIAFVLLKHQNIDHNFNNNIPYLSPLISGVGLALVASGFKGLKHYWQELLILLFLAIPHMPLLRLIDLSELTAKFATFVLWHLGFQVSRQGVNLTLSTGGIKVYPGCSGIETILHLLQLAGLFLVKFPTNGRQKIIVPALAICLGFFVNGVRVVLMAVLVASSHRQAFEYWHMGTGSLIFSLIASLIFGLLCLFLLQLNAPATVNKK